ncbi:MAG TPA: cation:proton antiporter [Acidimicrobiales bacterium]|nr:cation:proton antiporter [Acidimicrobiales bacterium]
MSPDPYDLFLGALGIAILAAAALPRLLASRPLSLPIVHLALGAAAFALIRDLPTPDPLAGDAIVERLSELVVIISLMGAGLRLDRRIGWRRWGLTWRLLAVAMPLSIAATAVLGWAALGLTPAAALLLGAVMAPTDPVLASDVQVEGPGRGDDEDDEVRSTLTSEAGLNDALAFPFTNLAIAVAVGGAWFPGWVVEDVVVKLVVGVVIGVVGGRLLQLVTFRVSSATALARSADGIVALGATLAVYAVAEVAHGYGFLSVFVAALVLRDAERGHDYHEVLHAFSDGLERFGSIVLLLLLGGAVVRGALEPLGWAGAAVALALVLLIRPVAGWVSLIGTSPSRHERGVIAVYGIRGMGSVYYLAHATGQADFAGAERLWAITLAAIVLSIVLHGATAGLALWRADLERTRPEEDVPAPRR